MRGSFEFDASNDAPPTRTFHLGKSIVFERKGGEEQGSWRHGNSYSDCYASCA